MDTCAIMLKFLSEGADRYRETRMEVDSMFWFSVFGWLGSTLGLIITGGTNVWYLIGCILSVAGMFISERGK